MTYPTVYVARKLKLTFRSRLLREVVWAEVEKVAEEMNAPDCARVASALRWITRYYREFKYDIPKLLSMYYYLDPFRNPKTGELLSNLEQDRALIPKLTVGDIPWETIPPDILEACLDDNLELQVTDTLLEYMGFLPKVHSPQPHGVHESAYAKYTYKKEFANREDEGLVRVVYYVDRNKKKVFKYYKWDEERQEHVKVRISNLNVIPHREYSYLEVDWAINNMSSDEFCLEKYGVSREELRRTLNSVADIAMKSSSEFFSEKYNQLQLENPDLDYLRKLRRDYIKEQAISMRGKDTSDTSEIWRLVKDADANTDD